MKRRALIIVDVQRDFLPGGALAVPNGDEVIGAIEYRRSYTHYDLIVASRDWHLSDHCSFEAQGGPWPPHCEIGTSGTELHPGLPSLNLLVSKGFLSDREAYSAFDGDIHLREYLRAMDVHYVDVCGLALDFCVAATARDAVKGEFDTTIILDATRAVTQNPGKINRICKGLVADGVKLDSRWAGGTPQ